MSKRIKHPHFAVFDLTPAERRTLKLVYEDEESKIYVFERRKERKITFRWIDNKTYEFRRDINIFVRGDYPFSQWSVVDKEDFFRLAMCIFKKSWKPESLNQNIIPLLGREEEFKKRFANVG